MTWQLFVFGYLLLGTLAYILRRSLAKSFPKQNRIVNASFYLVLYPVGLIFATFSSPDLAIGWLNFLFVFVGSLLFPVMYLLAYRANQDIDAGLFTILNNITPIVTIILATLLLNESLNSQQLFGAAIIIFSAFLATLPRLRKRTTSSTTGILFALGSVTVLGFAIVFERFMLTRMDFGAYLVFGWGAQTFWMMVLAWTDRHQFKVLKTSNKLKPVFVYGLANAFKGICFVAALKISGNASLVTAMTSFMAVMVVLAAYFALSEKEFLWLKIVAAIFGAGGLLILNAG